MSDFQCFWLCLQNGSSNLPNFLHGCRGQWGTLFELDMKKNSPGLEGIKCPIFKVFGFFSKIALRICPIFCMVVEGD